MRYFKENYFYYGTILFALFTFSCLCINAFNCFPEGDIFILAYINKGRDFIDFQKYFYFGWSGRVSNNLIANLSQYFLNHIKVYQLFALALIFIIAFTLYKFIEVCFQFQKKSHKYFLLAILFLSLIQMLNSTASAFYWLPSSIGYILPICIAFWSTFLIVKYNSISSLFFGSLGLFWTSLFSEIITLMMLIGYLFIIINAKQLALNKLRCYLPFTILLIGSLILFAAPGNFARMVFSPEKLNLLEVVFYAHKALLKDSYLWLLKSPFLIFILLTSFLVSAPFELNNKLYNAIKNKPKITALAIYAAMIVAYLLLYKIGGDSPPERILNIVCIIFGCISLLLFAYFKNSITQLIPINSSNYYIAVFAFLALLIFNINNKNANLSSIITDATSSRGNRYFNSAKNQYFALKNSTNEVVVVPAVSLAPSISYYVLDTDTTKLIYEQACLYFNKKRIIVKDKK